MTTSYPDFLHMEYPTALDEANYIAQIIQESDKQGIHYLDGLLIINGYDPENSLFSSAYLTYDILTEEGEMSSREALTLIDNILSAYGRVGSG